MSTLIVAEHDNTTLKPATLNTVTAAAQLPCETHILVAGSGCAAAAQAAAKISGVTKVLQADDAAYAHGLAENLAPLVVKLAAGYSHVIAAATTFGKNVMPRAAALLDVQQISDVAAIEAEDTLLRPIYAGNALATVKSGDKVKVLTISDTPFDAPAAACGPAPLPDRRPEERPAG